MNPSYHGYYQYHGTRGAGIKPHLQEEFTVTPRDPNVITGVTVSRTHAIFTIHRYSCVRPDRLQYGGRPARPPVIFTAQGTRMTYWPCTSMIPNAKRDTVCATRHTPRQRFRYLHGCSMGRVKRNRNRQNPLLCVRPLERGSMFATHTKKAVAWRCSAEMSEAFASR
jgi:hypothetical protein